MQPRTNESRQRRVTRANSTASNRAASPACLSSDQALTARINRWYDTKMFSGGRAQHKFTNFGYWEEETRSYEQACENLMERLLAFLPEKKGTILDVACGKGGTTAHLLNYYQPENVTGINISEKQLERCRINAPGCKFLLMSATELEFGGGSFDNIICVEAAFHFDTREKFLREALRVLKPGGCLALSDILLKNPRGTRPAANQVRDMMEYRDLYKRSGFQGIQISDATVECWLGFYLQAMRRLRNRVARGRIDPAFASRRGARLMRERERIKRYVLVGARKRSIVEPGSEPSQDILPASQTT